MDGDVYSEEEAGAWAQPESLIGFLEKYHEKNLNEANVLAEAELCRVVSEKLTFTTTHGHEA